jgi:hypothetical protein
MLARRAGSLAWSAHVRCGTPPTVAFACGSIMRLASWQPSTKTARDELDVEALAAEPVRTVWETMQPQSIWLWLKPPGAATLEGSFPGVSDGT